MERLLLLLIFLSVIAGNAAAQGEGTGTSAMSGEPVVVIDQNGNTAAVVTLAADGYATISAVVSYGPERYVEKGTRVRLVQLGADDSERTITVSETTEGGGVFFDKVMPGTYTLRPECGEYKVESAKILYNESVLDDDFGDGQKEVLTIDDVSGQTLAMVEMSPGTKADVQLKITPRKPSVTFQDLSVDLVELAGDVESDIRDSKKPRPNGELSFSQLTSGQLRVRFRCPVEVQGYRMGGQGLLDVFCPTSFLVP